MSFAEWSSVAAAVFSLIAAGLSVYQYLRERKDEDEQ